VDLNTRIQAAVTNVRAAVPNAKIVLTGYCVPTVPECGGADMTKYQVVGAKMETDNANVKYVDISDSCGGSSPDKAGDKQYFVDGIHINKRGYCKAFSRTDVQTAFACGAGADASKCSDTSQTSCKLPPNPKPTPSTAPTPAADENIQCTDNDQELKEQAAGFDDTITTCAIAKNRGMCTHEDHADLVKSLCECSCTVTT
jgi:hypothetical protein